VITFANLYGNTFDALLERLHLRAVSGSRFFDEIVVLSAGATVVPVGLVLGLIARRLSAAVLHRKKPSTCPPTRSSTSPSKMPGAVPGRSRIKP
jgi:hypothetical protein